MQVGEQMFSEGRQLDFTSGVVNVAELFNTGVVPVVNGLLVDTGAEPETVAVDDPFIDQAAIDLENSRANRQRSNAMFTQAETATDPLGFEQAQPVGDIDTGENVFAGEEGTSSAVGESNEFADSNAKTLATGSNGKSAQGVVNTAKRWVGKDFKRGQTKRCADFVCKVLHQGSNVLDDFHTEGARFFDSGKVGQRVGGSKNIEPGDVILFKNTYKSSHGHPITHVGVAIEGGKFVHRRTAGGPVTQDSYLSGKWQKHFYGARRPNYKG